MAIAEYLYRHEAEFAAGFLRSAGIPFRLQVDDAGGADAGVTIARPARIWVRAEDEEEARSLLDLDGASAEVARTPPPPGGDAPRDSEATGSDSDDREARSRGPDRSSPAVGTPGRENPASGLHPLGTVERRIAAVLGLVLFLLAAAGGEGAVAWVGVWEFLALALALALGLSAVSGRTVRPIKTVLNALADLVS